MVYSNGTLVIVKTGLNDGGKYICTARNIGGEDSVTSSVTIIGKCGLQAIDMLQSYNPQKLVTDIFLIKQNIQSYSLLYKL